MISRKQKKWFSSNYILIKILEIFSLLTSDWPRHFEFFFFFLILVYSLIIRSYYNRHVFSFAASNSIFLKYNKYTPCYIGTYYLVPFFFIFFGEMRFVDLYSKYLPIQLGTSLPTYLPTYFFFDWVGFLEISWYFIIINRYFIFFAWIQPLQLFASANKLLFLHSHLLKTNLVNK